MDGSNSTIIRISNLTRKFGGVTAVNRLSLEVSAGEIFGLVGPDGAGKTTTLRLLCGLLDPDEGEAWVVGRPVASQMDAIRDHIGYMAQRFALYPDLTVDENMEFYADLFGITRSQRGELIPGLLRMTRMEEFRARPAGKLSGGMKQKLALMCTLLHRPQVLFLDEPTNGVDPVSRRDFWAILYQLVKEGMTVFIATAYLDEAERCNRIALMHHGSVVVCDSPDALQHSLPQQCYEVQVADLRAARRLLRAVPGVQSVAPAGVTLHVFVEPERTSTALLQSALREAGLGTAAFRPILPSVEDVFIALIERRENAVGTLA